MRKDQFYHPTEEAINYALRQLAQRAGVQLLESATTGFEVLGIPVFYGQPEQIQLSSPGLIVRPCAQYVWDEILSKPENSLNWIPAAYTFPSGFKLPFDNPIPVIFWGAGFEGGEVPFVEQAKDGSIVFNADILSTSLFMLSRWEEMVVPTRDVHNRFSATSSIAFRQGFLDIPIIDQYGLILQSWLQVLCPSFKPVEKIYSLKLSFDIDHVRRYSSVKRLIRAVGGEILKRRNFRKAFRDVVEWVNPESSMLYRGILELATILDDNNLTGAFYFKSSKLSNFDSGYHLEWPWVKELILFLCEQGYEIGIHPGYQTVDNFELLVEEKKGLDQVLGKETYGGRQHFLRFQVPETWRFWEKAGLSYDTSMGYHDHEGFRCGTCHPYTPFDLYDDCQLNIIEIPLIVMDGTLAVYRSLSVEKGETAILSLARRCQEVGGVFTLLWHNSSLDGTWAPWADMYRRVVPKLANLSSAT